MQLLDLAFEPGWIATEQVIALPINMLFMFLSDTNPQTNISICRTEAGIRAWYNMRLTKYNIYSLWNVRQNQFA